MDFRNKIRDVVISLCILPVVFEKSITNNGDPRFQLNFCDPNTPHGDCFIAYISPEIVSGRDHGQRYPGLVIEYINSTPQTEVTA